MEKILIVDDDPDIAGLVSDALEDEGFATKICGDGDEAIEYIKKHADDIGLITLDVMMPGVSGLEVCNRVRHMVDCPIIMISAKGASNDIVEGLTFGADGYISKPFVVEELVARIKAHIRREKRNAPADEGRLIKIGDIELHTGSYEVFSCGKPVSLSTKEFLVLQYLMENAGRELTRKQIFAHVWKTEFGDIGTVSVNIKGIRDKLGEAGDCIKTVWGVGYQFAVSRG